MLLIKFYNLILEKKFINRPKIEDYRDIFYLIAVKLFQIAIMHISLNINWLTK